MTDRVPHLDLTPDERQAVHGWCALHGLDHNRVPLDGILGFDPATSEWRVRVHLRCAGKSYLGSDGEVATTVVRRRELAPLPWRHK